MTHLINPTTKELENASAVSYSRSPSDAHLDKLDEILKKKKMDVRFFGNKIVKCNSLEWLNRIRNVEFLTLQDTAPIESIGVFSNLPRLKKLYITDLSTKVVDFGVLEKFLFLESLCIGTGARGSRSIAKATFDLPNLKVLELHDLSTPINPRLKWLSLGKGKIKELVQEQLPCLEHLQLWGTKIDELVVAKTPLDLDYLEVFRVKNSSGISKLPSAKFLYISRSSLEKIAQLPLGKTKTLVIRDCKISPQFFSDLKHLKMVQELFVDEKGVPLEQIPVQKAISVLASPKFPPNCNNYCNIS